LSYFFGSTNWEHKLSQSGLVNNSVINYESSRRRSWRGIRRSNQ
jgi:hypothetical protein